MTHRFSNVLLVFAVAVTAAAAPQVLRAADEGRDAPSLDELLELDPDTPGESPADADAPEASEDAAADDASTPDDSEGAASVSDALEMVEAADVFGEAVVQMKGVSRRLGEQRDPGIVTQREQREIIEKLEQVIAAAKQQGGGGKGEPSSEDSQQQQSRSIAKQGTASSASTSASSQSHSGDFSPGAAQQAGGVGDIDELREEWGSLPPRLRNELSEGLSEPFSPVYRELTESFYRRLGEEQE